MHMRTGVCDVIIGVWRACVCGIPTKSLKTRECRIPCLQDSERSRAGHRSKTGVKSPLNHGVNDLLFASSEASVKN